MGVVLECGAETVLWNAKGRATRPNSGTNIMGANAAMTVNGCNAGEIIFDTLYHGQTAIAQLISNNIKRGVYAYEVGMYFSQQDAQHDRYRTGNGRIEPEVLPTYMVPEGVPGHKPNANSFTPH
jgi:hypothetical protein